MDTMSMQGVQAGLEPESLESFKNNLRGQLLIPGEAAYEEARSVWNAMIDRRPALIARCLGVGDVAASVNFARTSGLPLTIKGGGHNIAGLAASDGGLMIDMSLNRGVWVDPVKRTAHAQAGCILGDLDRETQLHGLAAVIGFISKTGIAGLTLGGGFGYLTRRFGWSCDNVRSMQVVTVDGRLVRASEQENADLFWGLRGGGGNFGVVTDFEYQLYPVGPQIVGGAIAWRADDAPAVAEMFRTFVEQSAPEVTSMLVLRKAPPAPPPPPPLTWTGCYLGVNVGAAWGRFELDTAGGGEFHRTNVGFAGGGQLGCDYQFAGSGLVIGFRNMFDGTTNHRDAAVSFVTPTGTATATADFHRWFDALTGRIGYSGASPWLVYFQGGAVWSRVEADIALATTVAGVTTVSAGSFSDTKTGWTVGGGFEYRFAPNWSAFIEGNYYDFGSRDRVVVTPAATACAAGCLFSGNTTAVSVLAGVNYRFWTGM